MNLKAKWLLANAAGSIGFITRRMEEFSRWAEEVEPALRHSPQWPNIVEFATVAAALALVREIPSDIAPLAVQNDLRDEKREYLECNRAQAAIKQTVLASLKAAYLGAPALYSLCCQESDEKRSLTPGEPFVVRLAAWALSQVVTRNPLDVCKTVTQRLALIYQNQVCRYWEPDIAPPAEVLVFDVFHLVRTVPPPSRDNVEKSSNESTQSTCVLTCRTQVTDEELDAPTKETISSVPGLFWVKVNAGPDNWNPPFGASNFGEQPERFWWVHYNNHPEQVVMLGAGTVMIIERGTGLIYYDGSDGGE